MMLKVAALFLGVAYGATTAVEIAALRDDVIHLCMKAYGNNVGSNCRSVGAEAQRHATFKCWKSGWSGRGKLQCRYGAEAYEIANMANAGDHSVANGVTDGRRMEISEEDFEKTEESKWETKSHPVYFELENIEDETEVMNLGNVSSCMLQGIEYITPEDDKVRPHCVTKRNADGKWELSYASAKCNVVCFPHAATRMF